MSRESVPLKVTVSYTDDDDYYMTSREQDFTLMRVVGWDTFADWMLGTADINKFCRPSEFLPDHLLLTWKGVKYLIHPTGEIVVRK